MVDITDDMIDSFYGKDERPVGKKRSRDVSIQRGIEAKCTECRKYIHSGDNVVIICKGIYCEDCSEHILTEEFNGLPLREKAEVLEYKFCKAEDAVKGK